LPNPPGSDQSDVKLFTTTCRFDKHTCASFGGNPWRDGWHS
jgi:hypothetical protein